jgi:hypothetical protein
MEAPMPPASMTIAALGVLTRLLKAGLAAALALLFVYGLGVASNNRQPCIGHGRGAIECDASVAEPADRCVHLGRGLRRCAAKPL